MSSIQRFCSSLPPRRVKSRRRSYRAISREFIHLTASAPHTPPLHSAITLSGTFQSYQDWFFHLTERKSNSIYDLFRVIKRKVEPKLESPTEKCTVSELHIIRIGEFLVPPRPLTLLGGVVDLIEMLPLAERNYSRLCAHPSLDFFLWSGR